MDTGKVAESEITRQAAEWCIVMSSGEASRDEKARFAEWITRSPVHLREYAAAEALWEEAASYGSELRTDDRVVSLFPGGPRNAGERRRKRVAGRVGGVAAAGVALMLAGLIWLGTSDFLESLERRDPTFTTMTGEMRVISLPDGSVMHLNTASTATLAYDTTRRLIRLERGQAYFDVRKDPQRPFVVAAKDAEVEAVGTAFDVEAFGPELAVTVVEGEVVVRGALPETAALESQADSLDEDAGGKAVDGEDVQHRPYRWTTSLAANQRIVLAPPSEADTAPPKPTTVMARAETAWRENKFVFQDEPLASIVDDFNRYNRRHIVILDEDLWSLRVSGTFDPRDPEAFAETIVALAGVERDVGLNGSIRLKK